MNKGLTRREVLQSVAGTGAGSILAEHLAGFDESPLTVGGKPVQVSLSSVSANTVRISVQPVENGQTMPVPADGALVQEYWGKPVSQLRALAKPRTIRCGELNVEVDPNPLTIRVKGKNRALVQEIQMTEGTGKFSFSTGTGPLFGLGQGGPQYDKRGSVDSMSSGQEGYELATHGAKVPIQLLIAPAGWAMFVHQPLGQFDLTAERGVFLPGGSGTGPMLDLFVVAAKKPAALLREYANIAGLPEMAPLWSFGYQQSHRTLGPPEEVLQEAKLFREKKLPCDAMIYLGTGFCPNGWNTDNGEFEWNRKAFPDPRRAIDQLHQDHFRVVLHVVLEGERLSGTVKDKCTAAPLPSGRTPDKQWPPDRQVSCYWPVHKQLLDLGIDGWWPDQGDGLDGASRLVRNRMYFEGTQLERPNQRVYALHRNGYPGMQRYAAFLWSGDVRSTWETLKTHVPVGINSGLSGIPYWGTDIGGFIPTQEYTGELFARWFQFAAFNPLFRSHGRDWRLHLPWGWTVGEIGYPETPGYEPSQAVLHNPAIEPICKTYLELRYRLLPYIYSAAKETCETGLPMMRALWLHYPEDATAVTRGDQYLLGRDLLVAPVVEPGATERALYLPKGKWFDLWTNKPLEGGREIRREVDLKTIPVYVRAGAILPMGPVKQYSDEKVEEPIEVWLHPGADGAFSLYEDDGKTFDFRRGDFMQVEMKWTDERRQLALQLAKGSKLFGGTNRKFSVRVRGEEVRRDVVFEGRPLTIQL